MGMVGLIRWPQRLKPSPIFGERNWHDWKSCPSRFLWRVESETKNNTKGKGSGQERPLHKGQNVSPTPPLITLLFQLYRSLGLPGVVANLK